MPRKPNSMNILKENINFETKEIDILELKYFEDNPRIGSIIHKQAFKNDDEKQKFIDGKIKNGTSVKNLLSRIKRHGGLIEEILVRADTNEVIEGNSRLAAYRILSEAEPNEKKWKTIKCRVVRKFDDSIQRAFLSELHQKGKTPWKKYEKAYWINHLIEEKKLSKRTIANDIGITEGEIDKLIYAIKIMKENNDEERENFSYYDVIVRKVSIKKEFTNNQDFKELICDEITSVPKSKSFSAINLRDFMPNIIKEERIYNKFLSKNINFYEAMQLVEAGLIDETIDAAIELLETINEQKVNKMDRKKYIAATESLKSLQEEVDRVNKLLNERS